MAGEDGIVMRISRLWRTRSQRVRDARFDTILGDVNAALDASGIAPDARMRAALAAALVKDDPVHDRANRHVLRVTLRELANGRVG
ncbi:hypothetical protein FHS96_005315 [Sphingomonas zeicaulis]|uniref:hypothetical protein n=1 Tax=Sphingomonas zeicaulis TaxID=1632740 RepID=UPI003D2240A2